MEWIRGGNIWRLPHTAWAGAPGNESAPQAGMSPTRGADGAKHSRDYGTSVTAPAVTTTSVASTTSSSKYFVRVYVPAGAVTATWGSL